LKEVSGPLIAVSIEDNADAVISRHRIVALQAVGCNLVRLLAIMEKRSFLDGGRWSHSAT
jgi:hypothetical protein